MIILLSYYSYSFRSYQLYNYKRCQKYLAKSKKINKIGQNFDCYCQKLDSGAEIGYQSVSPPSFEISLFFLIRYRLKLFDNSFSNSYTKFIILNVMRCAIWYHLYNLKDVKNIHGGVLILVKLQTEDCNFTKINTLPWVFFMFLKLYKWYKIAQCIT